MKSEHRHQLQTNVVAQKLNDWVTELRPYATSVAGIALTVIIAMFAWSYLSGASAMRQSQAWDLYNQAIGEPIPNMTLLRESADENPGTAMQQMADAAWADGQVWQASRDYLYNRTAALEGLTRASSTYQSILQSSDDERLLNRAHLGLARVYEMQDQLDDAREQYGKVTGAYEDYATERIKELAEEKSKKIVNWLATTPLPRPVAPTGRGTPGQRPEFSAGDVPLPGETPSARTPNGGVGEGASLDALFQGLDFDTAAGDAPDRYGTGETQPADEGAVSEQAPAASETPSADTSETVPDQSE